MEDQSLAAFGKALPAQLESLQVNLQGCGITDKGQGARLENGAATGVFGFLKLLPKSTQQVSLLLSCKGCVCCKVSQEALDSRNGHSIQSTALQGHVSHRSTTLMA